MKAQDLLSNYPDTEDKKAYSALLSTIYVQYLEEIIKNFLPEHAETCLKQAKIHAVETVNILFKTNDHVKH